MCRNDGLFFSCPISAKANVMDDKLLIKPLLNALYLTDEDVNEHLKLMGFTESDLLIMSHTIKVDIASKGGVKVAGKMLDPEVTSTNAKGEKVNLESVMFNNGAIKD